MITPLAGNCALESTLELHVGHEVLAAYLFTHIWGAKIVDRTAGLPADATYPLWLRDWQVFNPFTGKETLLKRLDETHCSLGYYVRDVFPSLLPISVIEKAAQRYLPNSSKDSSPYLEGGNVLFWSHSGKRGVMIGVTSVLWTLEKLKNVNYFLSKVDDEITCMRQEGLKATGRDLDIAKWRLTLKVIAEELQVSLDDLIVLEHHLEARGSRLCLHIDLTVLLGPKNKVFLHSPIEFQEQNFSGKETTDSFIKRPRVLQQNQEITLRNRQRLEAHGFEVIPVEGYYEFRDGGIYFLNGLLFERENRHFFVTGAGCHAGRKESIPFQPASESVHALSVKFSKTMHEHGIDVIYVDLKKSPLHGGVHCLTREIRSPSSLPPQVLSIAGMVDRISTLLVVRIREQAEVVLEFVRLELDEQSYQKKRCAVNRDKPLVMELKVPIGGCFATLWTNHMQYPRLQLLPGHPSQLFLDRKEA